MKYLIGNAYCLFENFFGLHLAEHLWGYNCATSAYETPILFNLIGILAIASSFIITLIYYYAIRHPRFTGWGSWLLTMVIIGIINLFIGYGITINDLLNGEIGNCLVFVFDDNGEVISRNIDSLNCWLFGFVNLLWSILLFTFFSSILKWGSKHAKYSPI